MSELGETEYRPVREFVKFYIGGGWGKEGPSSSADQQVAILRGADFPSASRGDATGLPIRWESNRKVARRSLRSGDIVLEVSGGTKNRPTGRSVYVTQRLLDQHEFPTIPASFCRLIRPDKAVVDPRYLGYWLRDMFVQGRTWGYQVQSTGLANFNVETFLDREVVRTPAIQEQRRIAGVLGAFDDLVELNRLHIEHLMALSSALYSLVRRRATKTLTFGDVAEVRGGGTPSTRNPAYWGGPFAWATPTDVTRLLSPYLFRTDRTLTPEGLDACASRLYPVGSILMTSRATIGALALNQVPVATNQGFLVVLPRADSDRYVLFHEMLARVSDFKAHANGSTFLELSRGRFKELLLPWPDNAQREAFHARVAPLHEMACALEIENADLRRTRDELLPLLMSGAVRVSEVEDSVP